MDAMDFFRQSAGRWRSLRTTHHLAFRRSEGGESVILVETIPAAAPEVAALCEMHEVDPQQAVGGCRVSWDGAMSWDKEGENHQGETVFALVPDDNQPHQGRLLRDRGYAEIVPVVGRFFLDEENSLVLTTEYETMSSVERFWFAGDNVRMRSSTVKRFGGFSTASFCTEVRVPADSVPGDSNPGDSEQTPQPVTDPGRDLGKASVPLSLLGW